MVGDRFKGLNHILAPHVVWYGMPSLELFNVAGLTHHVVARTICEHSTRAGPTQVHFVAALPSLLSGLATTAFAEDASAKIDANLVALGEHFCALLPDITRYRSALYSWHI